MPSGSVAKRRFILGVDRVVVGLFELSDLVPGATYELDCRFIDPSGRVAGGDHEQYPVPAGTPASASGKIMCRMPLKPGEATGNWGVEMAVNGRSAAMLRFDLAAAKVTPRPAKSPVPIPVPRPRRGSS